MNNAPAVHYPPEAYAPEGELWWELTYWPGSKRDFGDEARIAAWLTFNKAIGDLFTTEELRIALGTGDLARNSKEHFQRRLRALRGTRYGWTMPSSKHDRTIPAGHYRIDIVGWKPADGNRPKDLAAVSRATKRRVLDRDDRRCRICGIAENEPYPEDPSRTATMTVGHVVPAQFGGSGNDSNLRAECADCNESARSSTRPPEDYNSVLADIDNLKTAERRRLLEWVAAGHRIRDRVDAAYDRVRQLNVGDQERIGDHLRRTTPS